MHICVIGTGYVGLVTGACFAEFGVQVACVDNVVSKIAMLQEGQLPIHEPGLHELVNKNLREGRLTFTTDVTKAIEQALVIFIAVGTPAHADGATDLRYIDEVADSIGRCMRDYKVVATKSTVPVGTAKRIKERIQAAQSEPIAFSVVSNPEFLREGAAIEDFMRPNRVVIGGEDAHALAIMKELYSPLYLIETPVVITDIVTAEMIKYAANAFLAMKISFINEIANVCDVVGADVHDVARGIGLDHRIGRLFLHPGPGYGGSCFPKDVQALVHFAQEAGIDLQLAAAVERVNTHQWQHMVEKIVATWTVLWRTKPSASWDCLLSPIPTMYATRQRSRLFRLSRLAAPKSKPTIQLPCPQPSRLCAMWSTAWMPMPPVQGVMPWS